MVLLPLELLATARRLLGKTPAAASQAELRRCVSTICDALFHAVAESAADILAGQAVSVESERARAHAYRGVDHNTIKRACENQSLMRGLAQPLIGFADMFARMQTERQKADYDPTARFNPSVALKDLSDAEVILEAFLSAAEADRRVFVTFALLKSKAG